MRRTEPSKAHAATASPTSENEQRANQRRRERSRSRDSPRNLPFPNRDFSSDDTKSDVYKARAADDDNSEPRREAAVGASSSSSCNCASCGPWPEEKYRDLSIRYPGMTKKSFDLMLLALDEVAVDDLVSGSISESVSSIYSGVTFSPVEPPQVARVPASPSELEAAQCTDAEGANDVSSGRGGVEAMDSGRGSSTVDFGGACATPGQVVARSCEELLHCIPGSP